MPELIADGPTIPVHLMNELDSSRVVFFCGAGVSAGPGSELPGFADLVRHVYTENRMEPEGVEREALDLDEQNSDRRRPNFDKALGLLEGPDRLGTQALRRTVIKRLSAQPTGPLGLHEALIALSRGEQGGVRLVTTNFDNRFVEAGLDERLVDAAPKLPVPKRHSWSSLVHLHGRIFPNDNGLNLVLTAADFGRAYLTERWAARFVTELFREFTVVFVGYSISDPVMSYMVDALAAERAKGTRFTMAYAFADHNGTDTGRRKARDGWSAKNVEPILYDRHSDHKLLSDTLIEWARIRSDPYQARSRIALNEMSKLPTGPNDPVAERVAWALRDPVAAQALASAPLIVDEDDFQKVEGWLEVFAEKGLLSCAAADSNPGAEDQNPAFVRLVDSGSQSRNPETLDMTRRLLALWMARHLHVPQLLAWVLRNGSHLHPGLQREVRARLADPNSNIPARLRLLWTVLLNHEPTDDWRYLWIADCYSAAASESERQRIEDEAIQSIAPRLVVRLGPAPRLARRQYFDEKSEPIQPIDACGHLKLVCGDEDSQHQLEEILKGTSVLSRHAEMLTGYLDQALTLMMNDDNAYMDSSLYRPSIAAHKQNLDRDAWIRLIDLARDGYFALADAAPARGDNLLRRWVLSDQPLFKRLALHALTENTKSDIQLARKLLVAGRKPGVWERELRREVLRFFRLAGSRLPRGLRVEIVRVIHAGPKIKPAKTSTNYVETIRHEKALRLNKLTVSGARLDKKSKALAEEGESGIESDPDEHNEFAIWFDDSGFISEEEFAPKNLLDGSIDDVATALENGSISRDGFRGLVLLQPIKAASALRRLAERGEWPTTFWQAFLWFLVGLREKPKSSVRLQKYVALLLSMAPVELFAGVDSAAASFVKELAEDLGTNREEELKTLWMKAWGGIGMSRPEIGGPDNSLTAALNHAAGKLAEAALVRLWKYEPATGEGLPLSIRSYFDTIVNEPNGKLGRVMLSTRLYNLFAIDRDWVEKHLIPLLNLRSSEEARDLWSAYGWSPAVGPDLLLAFKDSFFEILSDGDESNQRRDNLMRLFMTICLEAPNELTKKEIHNVIGSVSEEALETVLGSLKFRLDGSPTERAGIWRDKVHPWLREYWPKAAVRNTATTSEAMLDMLVECGDAFEDAASWSLFYLRPLEGHNLYRLSKSGHAERHPDSVLQVLDRIVIANVFPVHQKSILRRILDALRTVRPDMTAEAKFRKLYGIATQ